MLLLNTVRCLQSTVRFNLDSVRFNLGSVRFNLGSVRFNLDSVRFNLGSVRFNLGSVRFNLGSVRFNLGSVRFNPDPVRYYPGSVRCYPGSVRYYPDSVRCYPGIFGDFSRMLILNLRLKTKTISRNCANLVIFFWHYNLFFVHLYNFSRVNLWHNFFYEWGFVDMVFECVLCARKLAMEGFWEKYCIQHIHKKHGTFIL